jgi:hypothetical protein
VMVFASHSKSLTGANFRMRYVLSVNNYLVFVSCFGSSDFRSVLRRKS